MNPAAPFRFACTRSGRCCRIGHGRVWVAAEDLPRLAAARGMELAPFVARHVVRVEDRLSLCEGADGRCSLLEGLNECSVYEARPERCRSFPFWPEILAGGAALAAAAAYCPGLEILAPPATDR